MNERGFIYMASKKKLRNDDLVEVMNYTVGELIYVNPRTQETWIWSGFGDVQPIPYIEIKTIKSTHPKFIYEPWFIILDDNVVDTLGLTKLYENIIKPDEIDKFYNMDTNEMVEILEKAPENVKLLIAQLTKDKIQKKEFGDLFKIRLIEEALKTDLLTEKDSV